MPIDVLMPQLSPTMTEGRLAKWLKQEGDRISAGDVIAEVETDKATMEVEASDDGILHKIIGQPGEDLPVGAPIAVLRGKDETVAADYVPVSKAKVAESGHTMMTDKAGTSIEVDKPHSTGAHEVVQTVPVMSTGIMPKINLSGEAPAAAGGHSKASPLARRLAAEKGVDVANIYGTGPHGRVVAEDIRRAQTGTRQIVRCADTVQKLTPMRKAIASRLLASKQTVPHFYLSLSANMDKLLDLREQLNGHLAAEASGDKKPPKISVNDFIVKACALGLAEFPAANAAWNGDSVVLFGNVDVAVAVAIDGGLITPIVANADQKNLVAISAEIKQLVADAKAGKLKPEQYEGGSFSLSNLGMYGIEQFQAIINPPQAAILACGAARKQEGKQVMTMTLSVDHRVIDGALGAELLGAIKAHLENPVGLVL